MSIRPKQLSRMGQFYLEESILDILLEAKHEGECLGPAEISRRAGIFRDRGKGNSTNDAIVSMNDAIVTGFLVKLFGLEKVSRCTQINRKGGWELTDKEFQSRRDDI